MLTHRMMREQAIAKKLADGAFDTYAIMDALYSQLNPRLRKAAERNVLAHLLKMEVGGEGGARGRDLAGCLMRGRVPGSQSNLNFSALSSPATASYFMPVGRRAAA